MIRLGRTEQFVEALAADGRSYSAEIYELALRHLSRHSIGDATAFASLAERVAEASRNAALDDDDFADAPDEFLDPLVSEIRSADFFRWQTLKRGDSSLRSCANQLNCHAAKSLIDQPSCGIWYAFMPKSPPAALTRHTLAAQRRKLSIHSCAAHCRRPSTGNSTEQAHRRVDSRQKVGSNNTKVKPGTHEKKKKENHKSDLWPKRRPTRRAMSVPLIVVAAINLHALLVNAQDTFQVQCGFQVSFVAVEHVCVLHARRGRLSLLSSSL